MMIAFWREKKSEQIHHWFCTVSFIHQHVSHKVQRKYPILFEGLSDLPRQTVVFSPQSQGAHV